MNDDITVGQLFELLSQNKVNRDGIRRITQRHLQRFLQNPNSVFGSILSIDRSRPFNPAEFIGKGWSIVEQDERSLAITELDPAKISLVSMLNECEMRVQGEEKLRRLKASGHIRLDAKVFLAFWENKDRIPESWKGKYVYFDGTVLQSPDGRRCILYLYWSGVEWSWCYCWLEDDWNAVNPSAVLAR